MNPRSIVSEAIRSREAVGVEREKEVEKLASYIVDVLSVFHYQKRSKVRNEFSFCRFKIFKSKVYRVY